MTTSDRRSYTEMHWLWCGHWSHMQSTIHFHCKLYYMIWFDLIWFIAIRNHQIYNRVNQMNLIGWFPAENRLIFYALSHNMPFLHNSVLLFNATRNCLTWTWFLQTINVSAFRNKCRKIRWPEPDGHTTLNINI